MHEHSLTITKQLRVLLVSPKSFLFHTYTKLMERDGNFQTVTSVGMHTYLTFADILNSGYTVCLTYTYARSVITDNSRRQPATLYGSVPKLLNIKVYVKRPIRSTVFVKKIRLRCTHLFKMLGSTFVLLCCFIFYLLREE